jgi:hypothetical protein
MSENVQDMLRGALRGAPSHLRPTALWRVNLGQAQDAGVDIARGAYAQLPADDTEWDRAVLAHELGHVAFTRPPSVLVPAIRNNPAAERLWTLLDEWRVDMRLVLAGHDPDPRIGMDRFDWSTIPFDAANLSILDRALLWIQYAYVQTGAQNPTVGLRAAELWSLLNDPWRTALTQAYQDISADPLSDALQDAWALALADLVPPSAPTPIITCHVNGMAPAGMPQLTEDARQQDQEKRQDQRNAKNLDTRADREQQKPDTGPAEWTDKRAASNADRQGQEDGDKPQGPKGYGSTKAKHAQEMGAELEDADDIDAEHPDAEPAEHVETQSDSERAEAMKPKPKFLNDPATAAAERAQRAGSRMQQDADSESGENQGTPGPSLTGNGPKHKPAPPLSETARKSIMASNRESWRGQLIVHSHLSKERDSVKKVLDVDGPSEYGTRVLDITRMWTDQKIFDAGNRPGGTVIIDGSSSMQWSARMLDQLILACPGVTVGIYFQPSGRKPQPTLCIVAKDGMRSDDFTETCYQTASGGNGGSDLPALAWLAESVHRAPRVILSDGEYWTHGIGATFEERYTDARTYNDRCNTTMLLGRILRVPTVADLYAALTGQRAQISDGDMTIPTRLRSLL